jgi:hypothetical protein
MEPTRPKQATLVDLLDRVLDKGLVIQADLVICLAGVPLVGMNLRAALAGMQTMLDYGLLQGWDERTRAFASQEIVPPLLAGEQVIRRIFGAHWYSRGIYRAWRPGQLYLTDQRIILFRRDPREVLFEIPLARLESAGISSSTRFTGVGRELIYLHLTDGQKAALYAESAASFLEAVAKQISLTGRVLRESSVDLDHELPAALACDRLLAEKKMWYRVLTGGILPATWRPGHLYLTDQRLLWRCSADQRVTFEAGLDEIAGLEITTEDLGGAIRETPVLEINCHGARARFFGERLWQWEEAIRGVALREDTCPGCGHKTRERELLARGCPQCAWQSPGRARQTAESQALIAP